MLVRVRLNRVSMRLAAAELLAAIDGGPVTERRCVTCARWAARPPTKAVTWSARRWFMDATYVGSVHSPGP
ncbi:MAG: hypothetical protein M3O70_13355 [Actinomycetota bacterium]|nr:hypothetical protein [Actinomycetota bacterium]